MYRFAALFAISALVAARAPIPSIEIESNHIDVSGEEELFLPSSQLNANEASHFQLSAVPSESDAVYTFRYNFGKRAKNDSIVSRGSGANSWPTPQDLNLSFEYPLVGRGAVVTYVEIVVRQNSKVGKAKVVAGGIGQRSIGINVKAVHVYHLGYEASFYGIRN